MDKVRQIHPYSKSYDELMKLNTFEERLNYLSLDGSVGTETFGFDRYLNQALYKSKEWRDVRRKVIIRDNGHDLGVNDEWSEELTRPIIHHINPITEKDIIERSPKVFDMNNLILCSHNTHNRIHYGDTEGDTRKKITDRKPNDTSPWRK